MKFISIRVRNAKIVHGFTPDNQEIVEDVQDEVFVEKLLAIERLLSVSEKYLLVSSAFGRVLYWEYEGGLTAMRARLQAAGLMID